MWIGVEQVDEIVVSIHVVPDVEQKGAALRLLIEVTPNGPKLGRRFPRERGKGRFLELRTRHADQIRPLLPPCRSQNRPALVQVGSDVLPIDLVEAWTIATHRDDAIVSLGKHVCKCIREPGPEVIASLLRTAYFMNGIPALVDGRTGPSVEFPCDTSILGIVPLHEPLVLPLPLGTVAEEENRRVATPRIDSNWLALSSYGDILRTLGFAAFLTTPAYQHCASTQRVCAFSSARYELDVMIR